MIAELQYMRAVAALMVVVYHTIPQIERMGYAGSTFPFLSFGVDIFFVISGFIMTYISWGRDQSPFEFLLNRIQRVVPVYWALTLLIMVIGIAVPTALQSSAVVPYHVIASLFFIPVAHPVNGQPFPLLQPGWTLNYEMYFYLIFAASIWLPVPWRYVGAMAALLVLTIGFSLAPESVITTFYAQPLVLEFCFGILLGWLFCAAPQLFTRPTSARDGYALFFIGMSLLVTFGILSPYRMRLVLVGVPSLVIIAGALVASKASWRLVLPWLKAIGDASYSLYLSHFIVMSAIGQVSRKIVGAETSPAFQAFFVVYATVICVLVSLPVHRFIEMGLMRLVKDGRSRARQPA